MKYRSAALTLLGIQLVLVLSVAGKYWCERRNCPRVWVKTRQYDPSTPLRGRYLGLRLVVDACNLPRDTAHFTPGVRDANGRPMQGSLEWGVTLHAQNGHLVPRVADRRRSPEGLEWLTMGEDEPCGNQPVSSVVEYFIPDTAKGPLPLNPQQDLWVEVTVPRSGPPRPIQLALSNAQGFQPLKFW